MITALTKAPNAVLAVRYNSVTYELPISGLDVADLSNKLGAEPADVAIIIRIEKLTAADTSSLQTAASVNEAKQLHPGIQFEVTAESGGKQLKVEDFGGLYAPRTLSLPGDVEGLHASAVSYDPATGELSYVPAIFERQDGNTLVTIYRTGNSIYTVVSANKSFADLVGHWAQEQVDLLASKFLIKGASEDQFMPDAEVSRAEFAALLSRAIGLKPKTDEPFADVSSSAWYAGEVGAASAAGIINGYENQAFKPEANITREQMAVMIVRAMKKSGFEVKVDLAVLNQFADRKLISEYADGAISQAMQAKIIEGAIEDSFAPLVNATRAEAAVMLKRMLDYMAFK